MMGGYCKHAAELWVVVIVWAGNLAATTQGAGCVKTVV
jgi:hypothetical protein